MGDPESSDKSSHWKAFAAVIGSLAALIGAIAALVPVITQPHEPLRPPISGTPSPGPEAQPIATPPPVRPNPDPDRDKAPQIPTPPAERPNPERDKETERAAVERLVLKFLEATQAGDAETFAASISDPFHFGDAVFSRTKAREVFRQAFASGGSGTKRQIILKCSVGTVEELRASGFSAAGARIVQTNNLRSTDYLATVVYKFADENNSRETILVVRPLTEGYEVIGVFDV